ncbi:hypothetical protein MCUN1_002866 [Malassezia cuniculi]|uniref:Glyoxalase/fosfomycin resistance/dioxygenase domain-containing protein n=1 Tax=Malassezia cuniculi TaxID=948313 RepID=A0AAF0ESK6_9BASI|nr:hypothetical protein MCUN1_002866 [Malassezia cuniculi]
MSVVREADMGAIVKVWLRLPADNKDDDGFSTSGSMFELVQRKGTEDQPDFSVKAQGGGLSHLCISVPDVHAAVHRLRHLDVELIYVSPKHDVAVARDPDGYAVQLISQELDKHEQLAEVCREVVLDGAENAREVIEKDNNPLTLEEAGVAPPSVTPQ